MFARHLDAISASGGSPELVSDLDLFSPSQHLLLTFDDGGKSAIVVAEQLALRNWKAHFFITTSYIGTARFVGRSDIRRLRAAGHSVGSHSHTHPDIFRDLPRSCMDREWRTSQNILEQILGEPCLTASVPGGDISRQVLESAAATFPYIFTSEPRLQPARVGSSWVFGRVCVRNSTPVARVRQLAAGGSWGRERLVRRTRVILSSALKPIYRRYVALRTLEGKRA
jgi:peptidoglycan/xylan/chitin deacetylase (PgdA/CDA1 family)